MASQSFLTVWHGTSSKNLASIREHGLTLNHYGSGADHWAELNLGRRAVEGFKARPPAVYVSPNPLYAAQFAEYATQVNGGNPVVLKIDVPETEGAHSFEVDTKSNWDYEHDMPLGMSRDKPIPAKWISAAIELPRLPLAEASSVA